MAQVHGKTGGFLVGTNDISAFAKDITFKTSADSSDGTTFGSTGHVYLGGLTDGKVTIKGIYDNTVATGPRAAVKAHLGSIQACKYHPEGTGTGKPESAFSGLITAYEESVPVADIITWSCDIMISGAVTDSSQA